MNDFHRDDAWQRQIRDEFLVPFYRDNFSAFGLLDKGRFASQLQHSGVDTIVWNAAGEAISIEEKIVRYKGRAYEAICLETESCTISPRISAGWMRYGIADRLLYCMQTEKGDLDCLSIHLQELKQWFWPRAGEFNFSQMEGTINCTACRIVDIAVIQANVPMHRFTLPRPHAQAAA